VQDPHGFLLLLLVVVITIFAASSERVVASIALVSIGLAQMPFVPAL
jgi:hypothetical protein